MFSFLSPTLAIQGMCLSVVGWQHKRQKINKIANWCTNRQSCGGNRRSVYFSHQAAWIVLFAYLTLCRLFRRKVRASNFYLMKASSIQKCNAGYSMLNCVRKCTKTEHFHYFCVNDDTKKISVLHKEHMIRKYRRAKFPFNILFLFCTIMCIIFTSLCKNFVKLT